jgi:hypothetical protein
LRPITGSPPLTVLPSSMLWLWSRALTVSFFAGTLHRSPPTHIPRPQSVTRRLQEKKTPSLHPC